MIHPFPHALKRKTKKRSKLSFLIRIKGHLDTLLYVRYVVKTECRLNSLFAVKIVHLALMVELLSFSRKSAPHLICLRNPCRTFWNTDISLILPPRWDLIGLGKRTCGKVVRSVSIQGNAIFRRGKGSRNICVLSGSLPGSC
jgi:hypothetical protein